MAKVLILANNDVGLYKFRKELLLELVKNHEVVVSLPNGEYINQIKQIGCRYIETPIDRRGTNPISDLKLYYKYKEIINQIKPDVVLTYTIKPNVYGGMACKSLKVPYIVNITGLGTAVENGGILKHVTINLYKFALSKASCVFFQNNTNKQYFVQERMIKGKSRLIPGSGVNIEQHKLEKYPHSDAPLRFVFVGRIMKAKGIEELIQAIPLVRKEYPNVEFHLIGGCEEEHYIQLLNDLEKQNIIYYHGHQPDVHTFVKNAHAIIHPSYHEGLSNVLLETASTGRVILASRVAGCLETYDEGKTGIGFEVKNVDSLVEAIIKFINLPMEQKKAMGIAGRKKIENEFNRQTVIDAYIEEIENIIR